MKAPYRFIGLLPAAIIIAVTYGPAAYCKATAAKREKREIVEGTAFAMEMTRQLAETGHYKKYGEMDREDLIVLVAMDLEFFRIAHRLKI